MIQGRQMILKVTQMKRYAQELPLKCGRLLWDQQAFPHMNIGTIETREEKSLKVEFLVSDGGICKKISEK